MRTFVRILGLCLVGVSVVIPSAQAETGQFGLGMYGSVLQPVGTLKNWYNTSPNGIVQLTYVVSPKTMAEVEVHYTKLKDAGLKDREFIWHNGTGAANKSLIKSPNAKAKMWMGSLTVNGLRSFRPDKPHGGVPYIAAGIGFYKYRHDVSGLIWPGQSGAAIKTDAQNTLEPIKDYETALSMNVGLGAYFRTSERFVVDMRVRWNVSMGQLRPFEDWGLLQTFPIQSVNFMIGFKYFWK
jgi:opacity protein-like surface antigen